MESGYVAVSFRDFLVDFIAKFLQFQPEVQQKFFNSRYTHTIKELLLNFGLELVAMNGIRFM